MRWCYTPDSCLGGTNYSGYMADTQCRPGHTGPFCDVCKPEHHKDTFGHCVKCDGSASATTLAVFAAFAIIGIIFFASAAWLASKKIAASKALNKQDLVSYVASKKVFDGPRETDDARPEQMKVGQLGLPSIRLPALIKFLRTKFPRANLPDLPNLDLTWLLLPGMNLPGFEMVQLPDLTLPEFKLKYPDLPWPDLDRLSLPHIYNFLRICFPWLPWPEEPEIPDIQACAAAPALALPPSLSCAPSSPVPPRLSRPLSPIARARVQPWTLRLRRFCRLRAASA